MVVAAALCVPPVGDWTSWIMAKRIGGSLAFLAFAVAVLCGVMAGNPVELIVGRAVLALFAFYYLGRVLGWIAEIILAEREGTLEEELDKLVEEAGKSEEKSVVGVQDEIPTISPGLETGESVPSVGAVAEGGT